MMNAEEYVKYLDNFETYQTTTSKNGVGTFFFTDCGNQMYSIKDDTAYHHKICPKCGKTLLLRGTSDGIEYMNRKLGITR